MPFAAAVLAQTPLYVWALLAWIVWQGVAALRPRTQPMWRVLSLPCLFIAGGVMPLFWRTGGVGLFAAWTAGAVLFLPLGYRTGPRLLAVDGATGTVTRAGAPWTLIRTVLVFVVQYVLAVASVVRAEHRDLILFASRAVSGATAGYFFGWAASAWLQCRATPERRRARQPRRWRGMRTASPRSNPTCR